MAEEIGFENGRNSNFQGLVTLTLTLDPAIRHTVVHHSSTSTYIPNFIQIEETFCGRTDLRTYGHFSPYIIRSTFGSRPKNQNKCRAPWKNRICSTTMKQKITCKASDVDYNELFGSSAQCRMHLMLFSERPPIYADICVHDNLGWKNRTRYNCRFSAMTFSGRTTEWHIVISFGELVAVD